MKKISHSYIIESINMEAINNVLKKLLKTIYCTNNICNKCQNCHLIITNKMPNVIVFDGFKNKITREDIINIRNYINYKIQLNGKIVFLLHGFEYATPKAANSLLKILEEPFDNFVFILTTLNKGMILETINSRCQDFDFPETNIKNNNNYINEINLIMQKKIWDIEWNKLDKEQVRALLNNFVSRVIKKQNPNWLKKILRLDNKLKNNVALTTVVGEFFFLMKEFKYD